MSRWGEPPTPRAHGIPLVLRTRGRCLSFPRCRGSCGCGRCGNGTPEPPSREGRTPRLPGLQIRREGRVGPGEGAQRWAGGSELRRGCANPSGGCGLRDGAQHRGRGLAPGLAWLRDGAVVVTPLDVVKIRLQAQRTPFSKVLAVQSVPWGAQPATWKCFLYCNGLMDHLYVCQNGNGCSAWYKAPGHFTGTLDAFVKIARNEGVRSLWSGLPPTLVMAVPATVIYFTTYDQLRDYLRARVGGWSPSIPLLAGALARLGAVTVISPLELIRTKMQSQQLSYRQLRLCIRSAVAQDGWLSLWRGWGPTVLRDVPFSALYWFNYELVRTWLCRQAWLDGATFTVSFISGAVSGTVAAVLTLPFDVVKTQRQIELGDSEVHPVKASKPSSTWQLMQRIRAESGTRGLFAGFLPRVIKVAPACAIMITSYEFGKSFFQKLNQEQQLRGL
ncbi:PREDICTED: solute carrier family 25 member 39 [Ficedula albicollis]|uniref:solute carrier family 25 member 39 n=1 Tax=Ficedula albicollis TaxID=59894 RepID=UPI000359CBA2|nr:PREDICTED: solute carrier family 25 member 39 [Ficedula albicollis]